MTTITREQQKQILIDTANHVISRDNTSPYSENLRELARIALASLEAKPVAWECGENIILFNPDTVEAYAKRAEISPKPLYTAPPAPAGNEFIPKNLDKALSVAGVALPESKEEFNFQTERWIQRLIGRVIRYADEFQEQPVPVVRQIMRELVPILDEDQFARIENIALSAGVMPPQPAPVVPEEITADGIIGMHECGFVEGWNACRTAMLQGSQPVSNRDELPVQ